MKVNISGFYVDMMVKNAGIRFQINDNQDDLLGFLYLTKTKLIWCTGRTQRGNGRAVSWEDFIDMMAQRNQ